MGLKARVYQLTVLDVGVRSEGSRKVGASILRLPLVSMVVRVLA